jgi:predicted small metal-binding protein
VFSCPSIQNNLALAWDRSVAVQVNATDRQGGLAMAKALKCLKEGCNFEVQGNSVDDVLVKLKMHAMIAHQMPQLPPDLLEKAKTAVRDV